MLCDDSKGIEATPMSYPESALWPAVGRQERLWGTGMLLLKDFRNNASDMQAVTEHPIQKFIINKIPVPQSLYW